MLKTVSGRNFIKMQYSSFPLFPVAYPFRIATQLQYYIKREKCKVNDVIFPSGCEAHTVNRGNKNVKISIFISGTSVRSKNIFIDISRYPTGKHEIKYHTSSQVQKYSTAVGWLYWGLTPLKQLRSYHGGRWRTYVSWLSHTSTNTTFLSKASDYFPHMLL